MTEASVQVKPALLSLTTTRSPFVTIVVEPLLVIGQDHTVHRRCGCARERTTADGPTVEHTGAGGEECQRRWREGTVWAR